jgi:hypothetical protein
MLKKCSRIVLLSLFSLIVFTSVGMAAPAAVNYQGRLVDKTTGAALTGTVALEFSVFDAATGGILLWSETQSATLDSNGIFQVILGSGSTTSGSFDADLFIDDDCWLEIAVAGETMNSRQKFASVPFALQAEEAINASYLEKYNSAAFVRKTETGVVDSKLIRDNSLTAADLAPNSVGTSEISSNAVRSEEILNGSVTAADLHDGTALSEILDDDGPGSGLNADLLDGNEAAAFALASHSHNLSALAGSISDSQIPAGITRDTELDAEVNTLKNRIATLETAVAQLVSLLEGVTRDDNEITFSGVNVHIVSGSGTTYGTINGLGNLIVGYNEKRGNDEDDRSGSHNIIVGKKHNYSSYAGIVSGDENSLNNSYCSVSGGHNVANGSRSTINGGRNNETAELYACVTGGQHNIASGYAAFVGGGGGDEPSEANEAFAAYSTVIGGQKNIAGYKPEGNHTTGQNSVVSGGFNNKASGLNSSVSGGYYNEASSSGASVSGGSENVASNTYSSISGGNKNIANASNSSVSGGMFNTASGGYSCISGGYSNEIWGSCATITGGRNNYAGGMCSSVSGGKDRTIHNENNWQAGSLFEAH